MLTLSLHDYMILLKESSNSNPPISNGHTDDVQSLEGSIATTETADGGFSEVGFFI